MKLELGVQYKVNGPTPKIFHSTFHHQNNPSASHLPDTTAYGTGRRPRKGQPPSQRAKPSSRQIEYRRFSIPPADEKLETGGHEPEGRIELDVELSLGRCDFRIYEKVMAGSAKGDGCGVETDWSIRGPGNPCLRFA